MDTRRQEGFEDEERYRLHCAASAADDCREDETSEDSAKIQETQGR